MFDRQLRATKDSVLHVLVRPFAHIAPNTISLLAFAVGIAACFALVWQWYLVALVLWWLNRILDGLDGAVARYSNTQSDLGGYLDILLDFIIYAALPIALVLPIATPLHWLTLALLLAIFYLNAASWMYLAGILEKRGTNPAAKQTSLTMPTGIIEGAETIVFYSLFILFPVGSPYLFGLMAFLTLATVWQRWKWASHHLSEDT